MPPPAGPLPRSPVHETAKAQERGCWRPVACSLSLLILPYSCYVFSTPGLMPSLSRLSRLCLKGLGQQSFHLSVLKKKKKKFCPGAREIAWR